jgi:hypothetical protein
MARQPLRLELQGKAWELVRGRRNFLDLKSFAFATLDRWNSHWFSGPMQQILNFQLDSNQI